MGTYAVRLQLRANRPLTPSQLELLDGGRHGINATGKPRGLLLDVSLTMAGGDVVGALARSLNVVLDVVPGSIREAHVMETRPRSPSGVADDPYLGDDGGTTAVRQLHPSV